MLDKDIINDLSIKIKNLAKDSPIGDFEKNLHALIRGAFTKMELVTREEYDIQTQVLDKTRAKLAHLEEKLAEIEASLKEH